MIKDLAEFNFTSRDDPCYVQAFELTSLRIIKNLGSELRLIFLLDKLDRTTVEDLDYYASLGIHGMGLWKDLIVMIGEDNHIKRTNEELMEEV